AWRGVYWPKWGDALLEAGFEPNAWTGRRDEDELLIQVAAMVRRLGKMPTEHEWRIARRGDPAIPSRTAQTAFGGRTGLVAKLRELANSDPTYADLSELLNQPPPQTTRTKRYRCPLRPA